MMTGPAASMLPPWRWWTAGRKTAGWKAMHSSARRRHQHLTTLTWTATAAVTHVDATAVADHQQQKAVPAVCSQCTVACLPLEEAWST
jgi:hypothetical protein